MAACTDGSKGGYFGSTKRFGRPPTTFYVNNMDEPVSLDPARAADATATTLLNHLFEGLVVPHPEDFRPTQGVATHWEQSADNTLFRFHLRDDARWSDGQPLVAADFVYAWGRILIAATGSRAATLLYPLKNGQLFHQGRLMVLRRKVRLQTTPSADGGREIASGRVLRILKRSPAQSRLAPLPAPLTGTLRYEAPKKAMASLMRDDAKLPAQPLKGAQPMELVGLGPALICNETPDRWYRVKGPGGEGYLPGCALDDQGAKDGWAVVTTQVELPTFRAKAAAEPTAKPTTPPPAAGTSGEPPASAPASSCGTRPLPLTGEVLPPPLAPSAKSPVSSTTPPEEGSKAKVDAKAQAPMQVGFVRTDALALDTAVLGVRAADAHTLEVQLERPIPYFLDLVTYAAFYPVRRDLVERFEKMGRPDLWYRPENIISNGPYVLDEHRFRYQITMKRNGYHYDRGRLAIHRIVWLAVNNYHAALNLYRTGEIDYVGDNASLPGAYNDKMAGYRDFSRSRYLSTYWYEFNVTRKPVDDVRVRRALNLAVNKKLLIERVARGEQLPATHYVPPYTGSGYAQAQRRDEAAGRDPFGGAGHEFDPARARDLLKEAGYELVREGDGWKATNFPALEVSYNTSEGHRQIAIAIQDMWRRNLGITVQIRNEEWKVLIGNLRDGHFQVCRFGWSADYNHPHTFMDTFLSYSANNLTRWKDPVFDRLIEHAAATADPQESIALYRKAEQRAVAAMPRLPLYYYTKSSLIKPYVKGYWSNPRNRHDLRWMSIVKPSQWEEPNRPAYAPREFPAPGVIAP